jgi:hypothetical protein
MDHYTRACCARFKPAGDTPHPSGDELDKTMVRAGIEKVKPRVIACGEKNAAKGTVKISMEVGGDGEVKSATVVDAPDPDLGKCVAAALRAAQFVKTTNGGAFTYPFVF